MKITITIIAITFMPLIFVAQAQEVKSQDNPVMQDRSWNLTRRSFEPPIQPVQQKKETQEIGKQIDRYTIINKIETPAQANLLSVVISVKFAQHVITVKQAIEELLVKSGYDLDSNYESEKISNFKLPEVHREIGPIPLKRAIKVLLGPAWDLQVDEISRSIQIVQIGDTALQILNPNARTLLKGVIKPDVLDEVITVSIDNEFLADALGKILPNGWNVRLEGEGLSQKTVSAISEDLKREKVIKQILLSVSAQGYFYKKLKMLVVRDNAKVIK
jgi:type IV pili sensor histidine kinase/response regulator